jgi:ATP-dependent DNA helicase RecQ
VNAELVKQAEQFLRRTNLPLEPRKKWPTGGLPRYGTDGLIPVGLRAEPGRALCTWGDAGWGKLVRQGKYHDGRFADQMVSACAALVREWKPNPAPAWVTCVPSLRHPELVPEFARRLAEALSLPFAISLRKAETRPEQKAMANSTQQARNVDGSLAVIAEQVHTAPVLLVDDMVDSRWTLTVAAWLLLERGSGPVWPLALAFAGQEMND